MGDASGKGDADGTELPSERYIDILSRGAESFGVAPSYVAWLKGHPCNPRKTIDEFKTFDRTAIPADRLPMTYDEVEPFNGQSGDDKPFLVIVNGLVLEVGEGHSRRFMSANREKGIVDQTVNISKMLYEPKYGDATPNSLQEMSAEHKLFVEDLMFNFAGNMLTPYAELK